MFLLVYSEEDFGEKRQQVIRVKSIEFSFELQI